MSFQSEYTSEEWYTLKCAPVWVFTIVAAIDGNVDKKEIECFGENIINLANSNFGLSREIYQASIADIKQVMACEKNGEAAIKGLGNVNQLLKRVDESEAKRFKQSLVLLGNKIAEASGGLFKKRSDIETKALGAIILILELN